MGVAYFFAGYGLGTLIGCIIIMLDKHKIKLKRKYKVKVMPYAFIPIECYQVIDNSHLPKKLTDKRYVVYKESIYDNFIFNSAIDAMDVRGRLNSGITPKGLYGGERRKTVYPRGWEMRYLRHLKKIIRKYKIIKRINNSGEVYYYLNRDYGGFVVTIAQDSEKGPLEDRRRREIVADIADYFNQRYTSYECK